ncbi:D-sedoheptulose 7-phosphate isomerase [Clostridium acidisoli DSM 12555]|jgi:D-sedoheptulose 7-phosphate isomerase|uniref:D-sedoheptulose 7-phosphate isomerase n=1 Tax=Clostridium acidisoli DSM 12555 TaxID=1121291 RepID=A0A1W1XS48_9CLOT|nr:SIS domain-containing protein [Clostridium acidisoli]SMC26717.1 D-sedoheptulose 7-phosphate isomerase [Clostridium acidisoli DSM 12555]
MKEIINNYFDHIGRLINNFNYKKIEDMINILEKARIEGKNIFILGNGGSATTANHFVCDFGKNAIHGNEKRFKIISLCDNLATITAYGNDLGYETIFEERLKNLMEDNDVVIALSASGNSKNVLHAADYVKARNGILISMTGNDGGKLKKISDFNINIESNTIEQIEDIHLMIEHIIVYVYEHKDDVKNELVRM